MIMITGLAGGHVRIQIQSLPGTLHRQQLEKDLLLMQILLDHLLNYFLHFSDFLSVFIGRVDFHYVR